MPCAKRSCPRTKKRRTSTWNRKSAVVRCFFVPSLRFNYVFAYCWLHWWQHGWRHCSLLHTWQSWNSAVHLGMEPIYCLIHDLEAKSLELLPHQGSSSILVEVSTARMSSACCPAKFKESSSSQTLDHTRLYRTIEHDISKEESMSRKEPLVFLFFFILFFFVRLIAPQLRK